MTKRKKREMQQIGLELVKLIFKPVTKRFSDKLDDFKRENLKRETEYLRNTLHDERKLLRLPIKNHKAQERKVEALHARHVALRKELKRLIRAQSERFS